MLPENRRAEYVSRRQVGGVVLAEAEVQDRSEGRSQRDSNGCIAVEAPLLHDSGEV
jgi:hypothetical protein